MIKRKTNNYIRIGTTLLLGIFLLTIIGPFLTDYGIEKVDVINRLSPPSASHFWGTDNLGRDIYTRAVYGLSTSLFIGFAVTFISSILGTIVGMVSAYSSLLDKVLMRVVDVIMAFPAIIVAIALSGILGSGMKNIIIALSIAYFPSIARITKNAVLQVKESEYVQSTVVIGKSNAYIIFRTVLPNIISPILVQMTYIFAMAILNESILSFLGVGIKVPMPSLGGLVSDGRNYFSIAPWMVIFPGTIISSIVLSLNMIGDGLREYLNPKSLRKKG